MEVPVGFFAKLWSFLSFLPFFLLLLLLALFKAAIIGPIVTIIVLIGNSAVIIGLWPAHFIWTYYCLIKTKRIGLVLKILSLICLPVPLVLWPVFGIIGSLLAGIGYGIFAPLIATFEAVGTGFLDKIANYFLDGCISVIKGACTMVRDFTDFCFHSYFSFMDELSEKRGDQESPLDIKLSILPISLLVSTIAIPLDIITITCLAVLKSPYMLFKGWERLFHDLIGREGPFLEMVCVPFAGLAILLWPLAVLASVVASFLSSFLLGFYAGVIAYQEESLKMGLAYMVSIVSLFDEYTNDLLYMREGSYLPRPPYRINQMIEKKEHVEKKNDFENNNYNAKKDNTRTKLTPERTKTLKNSIQQLKPIQVWDWLFRSCELNGRVLLNEGLISVEDINEYFKKGNCKKLSIRLPAWCILQCLLRSAKCDSYGFLISDDVEVTNNNWPKDRVINWIFGPLLIIKEQLKSIKLNEEEEWSLRKLVLTNKNEKLEDWDDRGFPSCDNIRKAQLQAIIRRLQGIVVNMTRLPGFRRRFGNLVKVLYLDAVESGMVNNDGSTKQRFDEMASSSTDFV